LSGLTRKISAKLARVPAVIGIEAGDPLSAGQGMPQTALGPFRELPGKMRRLKSGSIAADM
jgi:hypothetical protein